MNVNLQLFGQFDYPSTRNEVLTLCHELKTSNYLDVVRYERLNVIGETLLCWVYLQKYLKHHDSNTNLN